jgi:hypothetical protein
VSVATPLPPARSAAASSIAVPPTRLSPPPLPQTNVQAEAESALVDPAKVAIKGAPPWLVSLVVHLVLMLVMALIYFVPPVDDVVNLIVDPALAEELGEQTLEHQLQSPEELNLEIDPALALDNKLVEDPLSSPLVMDINLLDANKAVSDLPTMVIGAPLSGREEGGKQALLAAYGGTATTEAAVREGLLWLKRNQEREGTWSLLGPYSNGATTGIDNKVAATAMALLAFQGAGHTHKNGEFKDVVAKGWTALLKMQDADGYFECETSYNQRLYAQAQATIALCEIYGMSQDTEFKEPARRAIQWAISAQAPAGGWRYTPKEDSDTSVTGWYVMALQSGMMGYLDVDPKVLEKISIFLDSVSQKDPSRYSYQVYTEPSLTMTAEALLCRQYLGWKHDDERLRRGVDYLLDNKIDYKRKNVYYWYYATQVLHHMDGSDWNEWNAVMRDEVPKQQVKTGAEKGSWSAADDQWVMKAGRLCQTCLSIYLLEVYYRHLPIYKYRLQ